MDGSVGKVAKCREQGELAVVERFEGWCWACDGGLCALPSGAAVLENAFWFSAQLGIILLVVNAPDA